MSLDVYLENAPCPCCGRSEEGFSANITHNLNKMADAAGIYGVVWRPDENGITKAGQLIEPLTKAVADMKARPDYYRKFDADNGWGTYKDFVPWLQEYLAACIKNPNAKVSVSR